MGCTTVYFPVCHGLYNRIHTSWPMGCTPVRIVPISHGTWIVQWYVQPWTMHCTMVDIPMDHRLYNTIHTPCTMGCTLVKIVQTIHGTWAVQWCVQPWTMCCTMVCIPMSHGLYNSIHVMIFIVFPLFHSKSQTLTLLLFNHDILFTFILSYLIFPFFILSSQVT